MCLVFVLFVLALLYYYYVCFFFFFFNDTATTEIYTLSLHDALPISPHQPCAPRSCSSSPAGRWTRSEEHTSELQSHLNLVCRLLLEKKKIINILPIWPELIIETREENMHIDGS